MSPAQVPMRLSRTNQTQHPFECACVCVCPHKCKGTVDFVPNPHTHIYTISCHVLGTNRGTDARSSISTENIQTAPKDSFGRGVSAGYADRARVSSRCNTTRGADGPCCRYFLNKTLLLRNTLLDVQVQSVRRWTLADVKQGTLTWMAPCAHTQPP